MLYKAQSDEELNKRLIEAAEAGDIEKMKRLLEHGADVNAKDNEGWTTLMHAAWWGYLDIVKLLLEYGADVNAKGGYGKTALMDAAWNGYLDVVKFLVEKGADTSVENKEGKTAAMLARESGHKEVADYLDPLTQFKERIENTGKGNDGSSLELKPGIRGMLRTGQEYTAMRHGVSYEV